jgi:uncharacterized protein YndB with AHSA1/START domain
MSAQPVAHSTFTIERHYAAPPAKVFAAFSDPVKKRRWFAEGEGFELDSYGLDFRVGGSERSAFRFGAGTPLPEGTAGGNDTTYMDIVDGKRIVLAYTMTVGGKRISSSQATFEFVAKDKGTTLVFTEQAAFFEGADGPDMRKQGWTELLGSLARELGI